MATLNRPVLLVGESGTGKTKIAEHIHEVSGRRTGPVLTVNCPGIPAELFESEIFGHEKSAFTGANDLKKGAVELCSGGTLIFDGIGHLSLPHQAKLLTFLTSDEIKNFRRVGAVQVRSTDVRLIFATHCDLLRSTSDREFIGPLFWRLRDVEIEVPPLRQRKVALPELIRTFILEVILTNALVSARGEARIQPQHLGRWIHPREMPVTAVLDEENRETNEGFTDLLQVANSLSGFSSRTATDPTFSGFVVAAAAHLLAKLDGQRDLSKDNTEVSKTLFEKGLTIPEDWPGMEALAYALATAVRIDMTTNHPHAAIENRTLRDLYSPSFAKGEQAPPLLKVVKSLLTGDVP
jgi:hypothetical protein